MSQRESIGVGGRGSNLSATARLGATSVIYVGGQIVSKALSFLLVPVFTRALTPGDYGVLGVCTAFITLLLPVMSLGLQGSITRHLGEQASESERRTYLGTLAVTLFVSSLIGTIALDVIGRPASAVLFRDVPFDPYLRVAIWANFFAVQGVVPTYASMTRERGVAYAVLVYGNSIIKLLLSVYLVAIANRGLVGALEAQLWGNVVFFPVYLAMLRSSADLTFSGEWCRKALAFSIPIIPHNVSHWVLSLSDRVVLERYSSLRDVGIYSLGYQIAMVASIVLVAVNDAWSPFLINRYRTPNAAALFTRGTTYFSLVVIYVTLGVAVLGPPTIHVVATNAYFDAVRVVPVVCLGILLYGLYLMPRHYLFIAGRNGRIAVASGVAALVNLAWNVLLVPRFGYMAAAWGTVAAYGVLFGMVFVISRPHRFGSYEYGRIALALSLAGSIWVVATFGRPAAQSWNLLFEVLLLVLFPLVLRRIGVISRGDLAAVRLSGGTSREN